MGLMWQCFYTSSSVSLKATTIFLPIPFPSSIGLFEKTASWVASVWPRSAMVFVHHCPPLCLCILAAILRIPIVGAVRRHFPSMYPTSLWCSCNMVSTPEFYLKSSGSHYIYSVTLMSTTVAVSSHYLSSILRNHQFHFRNRRWKMP
jgi:hypothetical protein